MSSEVQIARRCLVAGRVQGVFYRASARQMAFTLGIVGYANNLADGSVEVLAMGDASKVQLLVEWLRQGPPAAHVTHVDVVEVHVADLGEVPTQFTTG